MPDLVTRLTVDRQGLATGLKQAEAEMKGYAAKVAKEDMTQSVGEGFGGVNMEKYRESQDRLKSSSLAFWGALTAAAAAAGAAIKQALAFAGETQDMADRLGLSATQVQQLQAAGAQVGVSINQIAVAFKNLTKEQVAALAGDKSALASFQALGVSIEDLRSKDADGLFRQIAAGLEGANPSAQQFNAILKVMGKSADELIPMLKSGMGETFNAVTDESVASLDKLGDALTNVGRTGKNAFAELLGIFTSMTIESLKFWGVMEEGNERFKADPQATNLLGAIRERQRKDQADQDKEAADEQARQKRVAKLSTDIAEQDKKNREKTLTPAQKRAELEAEYGEAVRKSAQFGTLSEEERKTAELRAGQLRGQLLDLDRKDARAEARASERSLPTPRAQQLDSLASIGGLTQFGAFNDELQIQRDTRDYTRDAAEYLGQIARDGLV